jgi:tetratricopeptide (TPR) repeat protein
MTSSSPTGKRGKVIMRIMGEIGVSVLTVLFVAVSLSIGQSVVEQNLTEGVGYAAQGKFEEAKEEFEKALKADPFSGAARDSLEVIEDVTQRKIERKSAIHLFKGAACVLKEQWNQGIHQYNKALEMNPEFTIAYRTRGFVYCCKGKYERAISDFTKAINLSPRYADAYFFRGVAYIRKGQYDQAILDCSKAIELNPRHAAAYTNRAVVYYYMGQLC